MNVNGNNLLFIQQGMPAFFYVNPAVFIKTGLGSIVGTDRLALAKIKSSWVRTATLADKTS